MYNADSQVASSTSRENESGNDGSKQPREQEENPNKLSGVSFVDLYEGHSFGVLDCAPKTKTQNRNTEKTEELSRSWLVPSISALN